MAVPATLWRVGDGDAHRSTARPLLVILVLCKLSPPLPKAVINISKARGHEWRAVDWRVM